MVEIFITDDAERYKQSRHTARILFHDGFIGACSFIADTELEAFNNTLIGLENMANGLMLQELDRDIAAIPDSSISYRANKFISRLGRIEKLYSSLFSFYKVFVTKKFLFQLSYDRFCSHFSISPSAVSVDLSSDYHLVQDLPYTFSKMSFSEQEKHKFIKHLLRQVYFFFYNLLFYKKHKPSKAKIAVFLLDIPNEVDLILKFVEHVKKRDDLSLCIVEIHSGNPDEKRIDASRYAGNNVEVIYLHTQKRSLYTNYSSFYDFCLKINPRFNIFKKARISEVEDVKYGFTDQAIRNIQPDVCIYTNTQEDGRLLSNVCANYNIPVICVDYSFFFDTYNIEKRIKFDVRACISEVAIANWRKHKDPTPKQEAIGFCKIDQWQDKIVDKKLSKRVFDNDNQTILFASTWAPNPESPLLTEKVIISRQLSEMCHRNGWNLIIKKHPSEFDDFINEIFKNNNYPNQKIFDHTEMSLFDCMVQADFVCTQNSSAFIEALYLNKPFSYITIFKENDWANMSYFAQEKEVGKFGAVEDYEKYILIHSSDDAYCLLIDDLSKLQTKYLFKTDGKASERLLKLAESFIK